MAKKIIIVFLIAVVSIASLFSEDVIFLSDDINIKYENDIWDKLMDDSVKVITVLSMYQNQGYVSLFNSDALGDFEIIYLSEEGRGILTNMINKYLNWETLAITKGVSISKDIPDLKIPVFAYYSLMKEPHTVKGLTLTASFYSTSPKIHYLILETDEKKVADNDFLTYKMDSWYFDHEAAIALEKSLTKENIETKIDEYNKQEDIESEFV
ncbi:hypothetical protein SpiGrapes_1120 [Sphaerochaeta pleomorpha str. Grapes]|uniref:Uncharacterized protein n=1 Tax=Sphaerochaeta pleomorpha (strain ATCC BAA-1885 / DSM 22778 / Grapes) TaxID=158190 RepID=G8QS79_SPHPG|nr:hypothetical protein [Sphaerochaeta pleomorpha]AEV28940.1 hypothetical protein SpiGrapes_1120 [Sphaerochaeta pleomorpha str. Grapes]